MSDWYVSSAAYAGYTAFAGSHTYSIGDIIVPTAPALKAKWVFRCTTGGLSTTEPTWATTNNATSTSGTAVFTNVTGQSTYFWTAAAGDLPTICNTNNRLSGGDRIFISSDHSESQTAATNYGVGTSGPTGYSVIQFLSVNRAGSTPPVAADITSGASISSSSTMVFYTDSPCYYSGITFTSSSVGSGALSLNQQVNNMTLYFLNCTLAISAASGSAAWFVLNFDGKVILDNTTLSSGKAASTINPLNLSVLDLTWLNTATPFAGTLPTRIFNSQHNLATFRGVDLSAITGTFATNSGSSGSKYLFDSCKIASGVTRYSTTSVVNCTDELELINCYDGTHFVNERYLPAGTVTTEFTITLSGGAQDNVGTYSHKMVSNTNTDKLTNPLCGFWMDVNYTTTGSAKTATVEIISSTTLNNDEIALYLQYEGTAGSSIASFGNSSIATPLTTAAAVTSSTATWNSSPSTPQKQKLQVTFTPQTAGRVRAQVRLGKASATVYYDPRITIT